MFENYRYSKPRQAIIYADSLLPLYLNTKDYENYVNTLNREARSYITIGKLSDAQPLLELSVNISEYFGDKKGLRQSYTFIGTTYLAQKNFKVANEYLKKSLDLALSINDRATIADVMNAYGYSYMVQGKQDTAEVYFKKAISGFEGSDDKKGLAIAYNNLASANYNNNGDVSITIEYYTKALEIQKEIKNFSNISLTLLNIANVYKDNGDYDLALQYFKKSIEISQSIGDKEILQWNYKHISETYDSIGDYMNCSKYLALALDLKDTIDESNSQWMLAELQTKYETERKEKAILQLENENNLKELDIQKQGVRISNQQIIIWSTIIFTALVLVLVFFLFKLFRMKNKAHKEVLAKNEQIAKQKNEIETQSERIKRQRDELLSAYDKLKELDATKDKFFTIIAHDIKNPVFNMQRIIEQLNINYGSYSDDQRKKLIDTVDKSAGHLLNLLQNLLQWAKSQTGKIPNMPEMINLNQIIQRNIELFKPYTDKKTIQLTYDMPDDMNAYADEKMMNVVVQNLIGNAIKFTPEGGKIIVNAMKNENQIEVSFIDTGVGISKDDLAKIFRIDTHHTTHGTNKEEGTGLGLILCREFLEANGGSIQVESEVNKGSTFKITLPVREPEEIFETENE